jgi:hypothetical protein
MNGADTLCKGSKESNLYLKNALTSVQLVVSTSIINLKNQFDCANSTFNNLDDKLKMKIETLYMISTED